MDEHFLIIKLLGLNRQSCIPEAAAMKLSIIIPTYNEANNINTTIGALFDQAKQKPFEIIVVDCGSADNTVQAIRYPEVISVVNPLLAGKKCSSLRFGANIAQGNTLLFLDADTLVPNHYDQAIEQALQNPSVVGGAFEFSFDKSSFPLFCISFFNRLRYRFRKRFYGDQGIFVRKKAYDESGGWPERSLLEAAYLCRNLQKYGRLQLLPLPVITSSRRFTEGGVWRVFLHDIKIWGMDLIGMDVEKYGAAYWRKNHEYGQKEKRVSRAINENVN